MKVILIMFIGVLVGYKIYPLKFIKFNNILQIVSISLMIFCMGVLLGSSPTFFKDLSSVGIKSLIYCVITVFFSVLVVWALTSIFLKEATNKDDDNNSNA